MGKGGFGKKGAKKGDGKKGGGKKGGKGKGKGKGGKGKGKGKGKGGPTKIIVEAHERFESVFVAKGRDDSLVTRNMVPGTNVYGEKLVSVETGELDKKEKIEYRVWNPFRSKLGACIVGGRLILFFWHKIVALVFKFSNCVNTNVVIVVFFNH